MSNNNQIIEIINNGFNQQDIEKYLDRVDVLQSVKELLHIGPTEFMTTDMVAKYFNFTNVNALRPYTRVGGTRSIREELINNGMKVLTKSQAIQLLTINGKCDSQLPICHIRSGSLLRFDNGETVNINNRGMILFNRRSLLCLAMHMRDNEVAKEIRRRLLDIAEDTLDGKEDVAETVMKEIITEQDITLDLVNALISGDTSTVLTCHSKINSLKNSRIQELEKENKQLIELKDEAIENAESWELAYTSLEEENAKLAGKYATILKVKLSGKHILNKLAAKHMDIIPLQTSEKKRITAYTFRKQVILKADIQFSRSFSTNFVETIHPASLPKAVEVYYIALQERLGEEFEDVLGEHLINEIEQYLSESEDI